VLLVLRARLSVGKRDLSHPLHPGAWCPEEELLQHLRRTRAMRRSRHHTQKTEIHGQIVGAVSISERPASVDDRDVPGHWEGDLMFGAQNRQIATQVERQTRYVMLAKVASKDTETVVDALIKNAQAPPGAIQVARLGSGQGDGRSQAVRAGHRHSGLLL